MDLFAKLSELARSGRGAALCTIIETSGSTPRKAGSKIIVTANNKTFGSVGGGILEKQVIKDAIRCISLGETYTGSYSSGSDKEGTSYGEARVFIDPLPRKKDLYIFGAGHVGQAVAMLAKDYGFEVSLIDHRKELMELISIDGITKIQGDYLKELEKLNFTKNSYVIVMTNAHESDEAVTLSCSKKEHAYLGMIGSSKKVKEAKKAFTKLGMDAKSMEAIDMPIGMPMNCETPPEIAISILARLIHVKNS